jgi:hypothetical protein
MEQMPEQRQQRAHGFQPGVSGNPAGRMSAAACAARVEAKARELAAELGGYDSVTEIDRVLLRTAAGLLLRRPKNGEDAVRVGNGIIRALVTLQRKYHVVPKPLPVQPPPSPSLSSLIKQAR